MRLGNEIEAALNMLERRREREKKLKDDDTLENARAVQAQREIVEGLKEEIALREKGLAIGKNYADQIISVNNAILQQSLELGSFSKALGQSAEGFLSKFSSALLLIVAVLYILNSSYLFLISGNLLTK